MESITVAPVTEASNEITQSREKLSNLLNAIVAMGGECAARGAHNIGSRVEDSLLYDRSGWGGSIIGMMNHHPAIIMVYDGGMCMDQSAELIAYDEQIEMSGGESEVRMFVITPDIQSAAACRFEASVAVVEGDDENNLQFGLEVDEAPEVDVELQSYNYKIVRDVEHNFAKKHGLRYAIPSEIAEIYRSDFGIDVECDRTLPAIYVVDGEGMIRHAYLSTQRPAPERVVRECLALR